MSTCIIFLIAKTRTVYKNSISFLLISSSNQQNFHHVLSLKVSIEIPLAQHVKVSTHPMYKVLVVEDSRAFRTYVESKLTEIGLTVDSAESLAEAKALIDSNDDYLFAVLDYCLPDGPNGEVIDYALEQKLKVIVLTGHFDDDSRDQFIARGVLDYIVKESMSAVAYLVPLCTRLMNNHNHKALVVDDSLSIRCHVRMMLERQYIETLEADDGAHALEVLKQNPDITVIISDQAMPNMDGISMTREIRRTLDRNQVAVLGLSGSDNPAITARFLKAGANDFLHKPLNQEEFNCRIHQILNMKEATDTLYRLANQDALTSLWNRRYLFSKFKRNSEYNLAMVDIDHFKNVNDTYGHDGGDTALVQVAHLMKQHFSKDIVVRFGGEEFCIISRFGYSRFLQELELMRVKIQVTPIQFADQQFPITVSVGASEPSASLEEQIHIADQRLYLAKESGRNQIVGLG